jgi:DNA-binding NarL/FixJ family response regulator
MKETDGITETKQIVDSSPDAKIIIVTDYGDDELRQNAKSAGTCNYVLKENLSEREKIFLGNSSNNINFKLHFL